MPYLIGVVLALVVSLFARIAGFDRDRSFYPTVMFVVAGLYGLFAVMGGHPGDLVLEWIMMGGFIVVTVLGFRFSLWLVAAALLGHGIFDFFHTRLIDNPGVPAWWPAFCGAYDVTAAVVLAWLLRRDGPKAAK
jgi:hypothetical protein